MFHGINIISRPFRKIVIMNKTLLSVLICTVALAGCKKDESDTPSNTGSNQQANQTAAKQNEGTVQLGTSGNADRTRNISVGTGGGSANSNNTLEIILTITMLLTAMPITAIMATIIMGITMLKPSL